MKFKPKYNFNRLALGEPFPRANRQHDNPERFGQYIANINWLREREYSSHYHDYYKKGMK